MSRILKMRHEHNLLTDQKVVRQEFESRLNILDAIEAGIEEGKAIIPKYTIDNFFFSLDERMTDMLAQDEARSMPSFVTNNDYLRTEEPDSARGAITSPRLETSTIHTKKRQKTEGCVPELLEQLNRSMNSEGNNDLVGMYASHGVFSNKS